MTGLCIRCHRELTDPASVLAGIGPVCAAHRALSRAGQRSLWGEANYAVIEETADHLLIKDLGPWDQYMTVTNAAETVVAELAPRLRGRRLLYIDSDGVTDELLVDANGKFAGFKAVESPGELVAA